jgi:hypothetical protein
MFVNSLVMIVYKNKKFIYLLAFIVLVILLAVLLFLILKSSKSDSETKTILPPVNLEASALSATEIEIRWIDNSLDETGYKIYRGSTLIKTVPAGSNQYQDTDLQPNTSYQYSIRSFNQSGESEIASCSAITFGPPSAPTSLFSSESTTTSVELRWLDSSNEESGYKIIRDGSLITTLEQNIVSYLDTGLKPATSYDYSIIAYNQYGDSNPCTTSITTRYIPLSIRINAIGVHDNRESGLRGAGDIYVLVGITDGSKSVKIKLPQEEGQTYSLEKEESINLGETVYTTDEVSGELAIFITGYESDGGKYEQIAYEALGMALNYYTSGKSGKLSELFDVSVAEIIGNLLGAEDDFLGSFEIYCNKQNNWNIGQYDNIVLKDERGVDCLRLWFTIESKE